VARQHHHAHECVTGHRAEHHRGDCRRVAGRPAADATPLFGIGTINQRNFSLPALLVSLLGAVILLAIVNLIRRGTVR
jgi:Transglycosylase associated protein